MDIITEQAIKERLHLAELLAHKRLGTMTSEEEQELTELLKDEHLKSLSERILKEDIHNELHQPQPSKPTDVKKRWREFDREYIHPSRHKSISFWSYAGAIVAIFIGIIFTLRTNKNEHPIQNDTIVAVTPPHTIQNKTHPRDSFSWKKGTKVDNDYAGRKRFSKCISDEICKVNCLDVEKLTTEDRSIETRILSDNSRVILNEKSIISYQKNFLADKREVWLYGEAQFKVKKDSKRPFIVYAGPLEISVLGTLFNVQAYTEKEVKVTVVEGSVKVCTRTDEITITPGYSAVYLKDTDKLEVKEEIINEIIAWVYNRFYHKQCPLSEVARILSEWYQIPIECKDEETAKKVIVLNIERYPSVYSALNRLVDMDILTYEYNEKDNKIVINRTTHR